MNDFYKYPLFITLALYVVSVFTPFTSPYAKYPLYLLACLKQPVMATDLGGARSYFTPSSTAYNVNPYIARYFCSEKEAQAAGYHKNAYNDL